ncbi:hypothetical protein VNO80_04111 [Phaseolus coccineus]|uniref:Uncharacterized protein n=1 Tax=Phaseolus coccineus TaxID=3886 RepID=A0AAN9RJF1_PHACN
MGLLADDKEFIDAIIESSNLGSGFQLRKLFVTLLLMNTMARPDEVWIKTWKLLSDDILYQKIKELALPGLRIEDSEIQNLCLLEVEALLISNGKSFKDFPTKCCNGEEDEKVGSEVYDEMKGGGGGGVGVG